MFSDEKIFTVEKVYNSQNNRVPAREGKSIPPEIRTVKKIIKPDSVMVWGAITSNGRSLLVIIEKGVKINKEVYIEEILKESLKTWAMNHFKDANWVFQQDSAPSHKAKVTLEWLKNNVTDFLSPDEWPTSSADLNPMDLILGPL